MLALNAVLVALTAASIALAPAALAPIDPVLQYEGTVTAVDSGEGVGSPLSVTIDCTSRPCSLVASVFAEVNVNVSGGTVEFEGGTQSYTVEQTSDPCALDFLGAGQLTVTVTGASLTLTRTGSGSGEVDCPDGTTVEFSPFVFEGAVQLTSGDLCALDDSCPRAETATPTSTAIADDDDNDVDAAPFIAGEPSTLSTLPTVSEAFSPLNLLWAAGATTVLIILVALPSQLMNSAMEKVSEGRRIPTLTGWPIAAGGVLVAAIASTFIEPDAVFDVRVFASILISFALDAVLGWFVVIRLVRRGDPDAKPTFRLLPAMLLLAIVAVMFSRFTGFQPGLMFGLVSGVVFASLVSAASKARALLLELGWAFALAIVGWIAYSLVAPDIVFVRETLAAVAIGGIAALPIALLPVPGLAGRSIFEWRKSIWAAAYAIGLIGFFLVLLPRPFSWETVGLSVWAWGAVFVAYAVAAVVFWAVITKPWVKVSA